jgi:hypothetical protein
MTGLFRTTVVEISGVRTIAGGGTNASNAGQALLNLSGVSLTGNQTITGQKIFKDKLLVGLTTPDAETPDNILQTNSLTIAGVDLTAGGQVPSTIIKGGVFLGKSDGSLGILTNSNEVWGPEAFEFAGVNFDVTAYNNMYFTAGYLPQFWLDTNGNVGINTAYPTERLEVNGNVKANNLVYNTSDQTIDGEITFSNPSTVFGAGNVGEIRISDGSYGDELGILTTNDEVIAIKYSDGSFRYGGGNPGGEPLIISNGVASFTKRPTVNGTGVLLSGERNKKFIYSGATRGPASRNLSNVYNNIAYGANCTFTPRYVGTIKAEASVGLTVPSTTADTTQAATFWYGTGTPPVFSGNLNDLTNITRIGGIKGTPQASTTPTLQLSPIGASWVAEVTGLTTGTTYWFDIAMSGRFLRVQDVQIYLEEIY